MARTATGAALTKRHHRAQRQVAAHALTDLRHLLPVWDGKPQTLPQLATVTTPLVNAYRHLSSLVAASYYREFRESEAADGEPVLAQLASPVAERQILTSLGAVTVRARVRYADAPERAATGIGGMVTRNVLGGGRSTLIETVREDPAALGWARVTDADPCAFCAMLAGRGPVYKTDETADFEAHDHCSCAVEPVYRGAKWPGRSSEFRDLYNQAIADASASGDLDRGTSNDLLNAFRRAYDRAR